MVLSNLRAIRELHVQSFVMNLAILLHVLAVAFLLCRMPLLLKQLHLEMAYSLLAKWDV